VRTICVVALSLLCWACVPPPPATGTPTGPAGPNGPTPNNEMGEKPQVQPRSEDGTAPVGNTKHVQPNHKRKFEGDQGNYLLTTLSNKDTKLAHHRGSVTFVAMWASFCTPCLHELGHLQALHKKYANNAKVRVLAVSIDDNDGPSRAKIKALARRYKLTMPVFIDRKHELMQKVAPRDKDNKVRYAVPMMVVIDDKFRLRRKWSMDHQMPRAAFVSELSSMIEPALRGEAPPAEKKYQAKLGGFFSQKILRLTVKNLSPDQVGHYKDMLRARIRQIHPGLRPSQMKKLMVEVEAKLRKGGTFIIQVPDP